MPKGIGKWYVESEKQAFWRGKPHTWVNRYVMSGDDPSSASAITVMHAIMAIEQQLHASFPAGQGVGFVQLRAYLSTGGAPFAYVQVNPLATAAGASGFSGATWAGSTQAVAPTLENCMLLETPLLGLSSSGKPLFLRKFYRGAVYGAEEDYISNTIPGADLAGIKAATAPFFTGLGGTGYQVVSPSALRAVAGPPAPAAYIANRQVPKGRKKKPVTLRTASGNTVTIKDAHGYKQANPGDIDLGDPVLA